jgi:hypothetical protein
MGITLAGGGRVGATAGYSWPGWDSVQWHERRKAGWAAVRAAMLATSRGR